MAQFATAGHLASWIGVCPGVNRAERAIRGPVVTSNNARGSHNDDSARLAATVWTVTATAQLAGLNVLTWLTAYLDACGRNNGNPHRSRTRTVPTLERRPRGPPHLGTTALATTAAQLTPAPTRPPRRGDPATPAIGLPSTGLPST